MTLRLDSVWRSKESGGCSVLQEIINESLRQRLEWSMGNSLLINSTKSKTMLFGNANRSGFHLTILLGVSYIAIVDLHKCLAVRSTSPLIARNANMGRHQYESSFIRISNKFFSNLYYRSSVIVNSKSYIKSSLAVNSYAEFTSTL
uniref:Uncharacterized protein n=1 Tax=Glossina austeni TaxID=7395 RepID=A0A1A9UM73_GLOAU